MKKQSNKMPLKCNSCFTKKETELANKNEEIFHITSIRETTGDIISLQLK